MQPTLELLQFQSHGMGLAGALRPAAGAAAATAGRTLTYLHAGVADTRSWTRQIEHFSDYQQLAWDRRGYGTNATSAGTHAHLDDLIALLDRAAVERSILVGCSMGGLVALQCALHFPDRVSGLVLAAPAISGAPAASPSAEAQKLFAAAAVAEGNGDLARVNELEAQLWLDGPGSAAGRVSGGLRDLFLDINGIALRHEDQNPEPATPEVFASLPEIQVPALVICGDLDLPHVFQRARAAAQALPAAQFQVLSGVAHLSHLEHPVAFNRYVRRWLDATPLL